MARMARRIEPSRKSPAERLEDLLAGYRDAPFPGGAAKYLERAIASSDSMPNAVKFFAWALLVSASYAFGTPEGEDRAAFDEALRLCDVAISLGYGRAYEAKKNS